MGGVVVLVQERISKFVKRICPDFEYGIILVIDKTALGTDRDCAYISVYIPPDGSPFYEHSIQSGPIVVENIVIGQNLTDFSIILNGDLNARTGNCEDTTLIVHSVPELDEFNDILNNDLGMVRSNSDVKVNKFGRQLIHFCKTYECSIINGRMGKDAGKGEYTFINQNGCSVIDYFVVSNELMHIITEFEILSYPDSSHMPICLEFNSPSISLTKNKDGTKHQPITKYNINAETCEVYLQSLTNDTSNNCFQMFEENVKNYDVNIDNVIDEFENALLTSSNKLKRTVKPKYSSHRRDWFDKECMVHRKIAKSSLKRFRSSRSVNKLDIYLNHKRSYKSICKRKRQTYNKEQINKLEMCVKNTSMFWKEVRKLSNKPKTTSNISLDDWYNYFRTLFASDSCLETDNVDEIHCDRNIDEVESIMFNSPIDDGEILSTIKQLNVNKAFAGKITPHHMKFGIPVLLPYINMLFNRLYVTGEFPISWSRILLIPIYKKGNVSEPNNYRGIALMDILSKVYISILTKRLTFYVEAYGRIAESQAGFRSGYSTVDNAFVLYSLVSKYFNKNKRPLYVAFVDFEKAFDSVSRPILYNVLHKNGVQGNLFRAIQAIYSSVKACVKSNEGISNVFSCPIGLRQGCSLSPILFSLFINELYDVMKSSDVRGIQLFPDLTEIFLLMFADDIGLISDTISGLQKQLNILSTFCNSYKLKVNIPKTKVVVFKKGGQLSKKERWFYNGKDIEVVQNFSYVGINFSNRLSMYKMAEAASIKAKKVLMYLFSTFNKMLYIPVNTFFKVFDTRICPVMLYGSELWGLQYMNCIEHVQIYACKRLLNIGMDACNLSVLGDTGRYPVQIMASKRVIKYWIRILKLPKSRFVKLCYNMLLHYDKLGYSNWVTLVRTNLYSNGFGHVWEQQHIENEKLFIYKYNQRLRDQYMQEWMSGCLENKKLTYYCGFKQLFCQESYLSIIDVNKFRTCLASFRNASHSLMVEKGRHYGLPREYRFCVFCEGFIEDELHFLLFCPLYTDLRESYINKRFLNIPNERSFLNIMSCTNETVVRNLAMFLYYAFQKRDEYMNGQEV